MSTMNAIVHEACGALIGILNNFSGAIFIFLGEL